MAGLWRAVPSWEGVYEVSSTGAVRSLDRMERAGGRIRRRRGRVRKLGLDRDGYPTVSVCRDGKRGTVKVQTLVAAAFLGPRPEGFQVCHNNGVRTDVSAANLRYDTPSNNTLDQVRHGTHRSSRKTECSSGHEYTEENTGRRNGGRWRYCKACDREMQARKYERRRSA